MENKQLKKQIILALIPLIALSFAVLFGSSSGTFRTTKYKLFNNAAFGQPEYASGDQKPEMPSPEPVYVSIFKFIVNCNPFKKEAQY
jgi:hypothetical protein